MDRCKVKAEVRQQWQKTFDENYTRSLDHHSLIFKQVRWRVGFTALWDNGQSPCVAAGSQSGLEWKKFVKVLNIDTRGFWVWHVLLFRILECYSLGGKVMRLICSVNILRHC